MTWVRLQSDVVEKNKRGALTMLDKIKTRKPDVVLTTPAQASASAINITTPKFELEYTSSSPLNNPTDGRDFTKTTLAPTPQPTLHQQIP